jgi:hypothetical protein
MRKTKIRTRTTRKKKTKKKKKKSGGKKGERKIEVGNV